MTRPGRRSSTGSASEAFDALVVLSGCSACRRLPGYHRHTLILDSQERHASAPAGPARRAWNKDGWDIIVLLMIVGAAVAVRLPLMDHRMAVDESYTYLGYARQPLSVGLSSYLYPNNHLFHTLLVHFSTGVFGSAPWAIRLPAFIAGIALVPATYAAGRSLYNRSTGLMAAAFVAGSAPLVEYSVNARGYTIVALVFMVLLAMGPALLRSESLRLWCAYALLVTIGFYTVPTMLFAFGVVASWLALSAIVEPGIARGRFVIRWIVATAAAGAATVALYWPVIAASGLKSITANQFTRPLPFASFRSGFGSFAGDVGRYFTYALPAVFVVLVLIGFAIALAGHSRIARQRIPVAAVAVAWVLLQMIAERVLPFARVLLFLLPLFFLTAAAGIVFAIGSIRRLDKSAAAIAATIAAAVILPLHVATTKAVDLSMERGGLPDVEAVTAWLRPRLRPGDRVVAIGTTSWPIQYYFERDGIGTRPLLISIRVADRLYLVVNTWEHETLNEFIRTIHGTGNPPRVPGFGLPRLMRRSPDSDVYELRRGPPS